MQIQPMNGGLYVHVQGARPGASWAEELAQVPRVSLPAGQPFGESFTENKVLAERLLRHPARTWRLHAAGAAVVLNTVALCCGSDNLTAPTRSMLRGLPVAVRRHHNLYLVLEGTMRSARCYAAEELPSQATYLSILPLYAYKGRGVELGYHAEPRRPAPLDACYPLAPEGRLAGQRQTRARAGAGASGAGAAGAGREVAVGIPFRGELPSAVLATEVERTPRSFLAFYVGGDHGRATALRRRLSKLVALYQQRDRRLTTGGSPPPSSQPSWLGRDYRLLVAGWGTGTGTPSSSISPWDAAYLRSTFVLLPTGDYPMRDSQWRAMRLLAIPVYFASCTSSVLLNGFPLFLPPEHSPRFGANRWAVLLNQSAVMSDAGYLARELRAIPPSKVEAMQRCLAGLRERFSYDQAPSERDAVATLVQRLLHPSAANALEAQCAE